MNKKIMSAFVTILAATASFGIASAASAQSTPPDYFALKAGVYSPSESHDLDTFNAGVTSRLDSKTGFSGEIVAGHYFSPMLALELGAGYFESKGHPEAAQAGDLKLRVVPVIATGKVLFPVGIFEPYGLFGIGAYFTDLKVSGNTGSFSGSSEVTYGLHTGAGCNFNLNQNTFLGLEGKYLWAKDSFRGQHIKLDGFITTAGIGFRF